jgi:O-antigen/teichoic acid export membrane protein
MSLRSQVTGGLKWQAIMVVGRQLLSLAIFTILARLLGPAEFGLMGLTFIYLTIVGYLADQGIGTALVQRAQLDPEHLHTAFWFNFGCAAFLCGTTLLLAEAISTLLGEPRLASLLRWTSISLLFNASSAIQNALFTRQMDFRRPALRALVGQIAGGGVGIGMALTGYGVWALVGQQITGSAVGALFLAIAAAYRPALRFSWRHLRELLGFSSPLVANWLLDLVGSRSDQLLIGKFLGTQVLGIYVVACRIPDLLKQTIIQAVSDVSMPALSRLQQDLPKMTEAIYRGMALNSVVMLAIFPGVAAVAPDLIPLLLGSKWQESGYLCSLLSLYVLIRALQVFTYPALLAAGVTLEFFYLNVVNLVGIVLACFIGIRFGVAQLVVGLIVVNSLMVIPYMVLLRKKIGLSPASYWAPCVLPACAAVLMLLVVRAIAASLPATTIPWVRLAALTGSGAAAYLGFLQLFCRTRLHELWHMVAHTVTGSRPVAGVEIP